MKEFDITRDEDYQDAAKSLVGAEQRLFGDVEATATEDELDIDEIVQQLYEICYG